MAWENVKLADVKIEGPSPLEAGDVVAQLLPTAQYRERNGVTELSFRASIVEGDQTGRQFFMQYPDPESVDKNGKKRAWAAQALKVLETALGEDAKPGEDTADFINRVASNGHGRFGITLAASNYVPAGQTEPKVEAKLFSVRPAA